MAARGGSAGQRPSRSTRPFARPRRALAANSPDGSGDNLVAHRADESVAARPLLLVDAGVVQQSLRAMRYAFRPLDSAPAARCDEQLDTGSH